MKVTIVPPKNCDIRNIKHEFKRLQNGFIDIATYPNGVEVVFTNVNGTTHVEPSKPLIKLDEYTYQVPE